MKLPLKILPGVLILAFLLTSCSITPYYHGVSDDGVVLVPVEIPDTLLPEIKEPKLKGVKNVKLSPKEKKYVETEEKKLGIEIPDNRREIAKWIRYYGKNPFGRRWLEKSIERGAPYLPIIRKKLREAGLPEELAYLPVIESGFKPLARSRAGAVGVWQFIPGSARKFGLTVNWWIDERRDPIKSTDAAVKYLKTLYQIFGKWDLALTAYNYGEGKLQRKIRRMRTDNFWKLKRRLPRETRNYVPQFFAVLTVLSHPELYGIRLKTTADPFVYDSVRMPGPVSLDVAAKWAGVPIGEMIKYNLSFKRGMAPPYYKNYYLRIPPGTKDRFVAAMQNTPRRKWYTITYHRVRRGENLYVIARRYGVSVRELMRVNRIRNPRRIRRGRILVIPISEGYAQYMAENVNLKIVNKNHETRVVYYRVKRGDTLKRIARKFGVTVAQLKRWNHLRSSRIRPGHKLIVFKQGAKVKRYTKTKSRKTKLIKYRIRKGDTLYAISARYGVSVSKLMKVNRIKDPKQIKPGRVVRIPVDI